MIGTYGSACRRTVASCSRATATSTPLARSSAWAASVLAPGSCYSGRDDADRCSSSSRRRSRRCWSRTSARAVSLSTGSASSRGSGWCRPRPTSPRLGADSHDRRGDAGLLHPSALGHEGSAEVEYGAGGARDIRADLRLDAGESPRPVRRQGRDRRLSRRGDAFDRALASFAEAYADQNERTNALQGAVPSGRVAAQLGV